jgi:hypothetical protein
MARWAGLTSVDVWRCDIVKSGVGAITIGGASATAMYPISPFMPTATG